MPFFLSSFLRLAHTEYVYVLSAMLRGSGGILAACGLSFFLSLSQSVIFQHILTTIKFFIRATFIQIHLITMQYHTYGYACTETRTYSHTVTRASIIFCDVRKLLLNSFIAPSISPSFACLSLKYVSITSSSISSLPLRYSYIHISPSKCSVAPKNRLNSRQKCECHVYECIPLLHEKLQNFNQQLMELVCVWLIRILVIFLPNFCETTFSKMQFLGFQDHMMMTGDSFLKMLLAIPIALYSCVMCNKMKPDFLHSFHIFQK